MPAKTWLYTEFIHSFWGTYRAVRFALSVMNSLMITLSI